LGKRKKGRHGIVKLHGDLFDIGGRQVHIQGLPKDITHIDYAPEVGCAQLRERCDRIRELEPREVRKLDRWLRRVHDWLLR
jgi:hypothetical protein